MLLNVPLAILQHVASTADSSVIETVWFVSCAANRCNLEPNNIVHLGTLGDSPREVCGQPLRVRSRVGCHSGM